MRKRYYIHTMYMTRKSRQSAQLPHKLVRLIPCFGLLVPPQQRRIHTHHHHHPSFVPSRRVAVHFRFSLSFLCGVDTLLIFFCVLLLHFRLADICQLGQKPVRTELTSSGRECTVCQRSFAERILYLAQEPWRYPHRRYHPEASYHRDPVGCLLGPVSHAPEHPFPPR